MNQAIEISFNQWQNHLIAYFTVDLILAHFPDGLMFVDLTVVCCRDSCLLPRYDKICHHSSSCFPFLICSYFCFFFHTSLLLFQPHHMGWSRILIFSLSLSLYCYCWAFKNLFAFFFLFDRTPLRFLLNDLPIIKANLLQFWYLLFWMILLDD